MAESSNCFSTSNFYTSSNNYRSSSTRTSNLQGSSTSNERKCQRGSKRFAQSRAISMFDQIGRTGISVESKSTKPSIHSQWPWTTPGQHSKQSWNEEIRQCSITISCYTVLHIKKAFHSMWSLETFSEERILLK